MSTNELDTDAHQRHLTIARTCLHRAADLLDQVHEPPEAQEALGLVFIALEELDPAAD